MTRTMNDIAKYCAVRHYNIYDQMPPLNNEVLSESTDDKIVLKCPWCGKRYVLDPYYAEAITDVFFHFVLSSQRRRSSQHCKIHHRYADCVQDLFEILPVQIRNFNVYLARQLHDKCLQILILSYNKPCFNCAPRTKKERTSFTRPILRS